MSQLGVQLITGSYDHQLNFWDANSGQCLLSIDYSEKKTFIINRIEISLDKCLLGAACSQAAMIYDIQKVNNNTPIQCFDNYQGNVTSIGFQKDRKWIYTSSEDGTLKIHDIQAKPTGYNRTYTNKNKEPFNSVVLHPNEGELIAGDQAGNIKIYDLVADKLREEYTPCPDIGLRSLSISQNSNFLVAADSAGIVHHYSINPNSQNNESLTLIQQLEAHNDYILKCVISPNSQKMATCSADKTIKLWDRVNDQYQYFKTLYGHSKWVWDCAFSCDTDFLISVSSDQVAKIWKTQTGETVKVLKGHKQAINCIALNDTEGID